MLYGLCILYTCTCNHWVFGCVHDFFKSNGTHILFTPTTDTDTCFFNKISPKSITKLQNYVFMARWNAEISQSAVNYLLLRYAMLAQYVFLSILRNLIVSPVLQFSGLIQHTTCYDKQEVQTKADETCTNPLMSVTFAGPPDEVSLCRYLNISAQLISFFHWPECNRSPNISNNVIAIAVHNAMITRNFWPYKANKRCNFFDYMYKVLRIVCCFCKWRIPLRRNIGHVDIISF